MNVTGDPRRVASDNASDGVVHFFPAYLYRSYFNSTTEAEETERALSTWKTPSCSRARPTLRR